VQPAHVVVCFHHWGLVSGRFCFSLARAVAYEGNRIARVIDLPSPYTDEARDKLVGAFLAVEGEPRYMLMVDADIEFDKDAISKTMWVALNHDADVVWGNYALGDFRNSLFRKDENSDLAVCVDDMQPDMIYHNVYAGGTGWALIDRRILLKMKDIYPEPWHWFERDVTGGPGGVVLKLGEDISFGRRVYKAGGKQVGYTGIHLYHHKNQPIVPLFMKGAIEGVGRKVLNASGTPSGLRDESVKEAVPSESGGVVGSGDSGSQSAA